MSELNLTSFLTDFAALPDPRLVRRRHWGTENRLHGVLDVAASCAIIRKFALHLLRA